MRTAGRVRLGNLPVELTSFLGRGSELADVKRRLADARLITLTGVGGIGKTRVALRAAARLAPAFPDGVWFVDLAQVHGPGPLTAEAADPQPLAYLVRTALGLRQAGAESPMVELTRFLAGRQTLLVLDNCEHLIAACAVLADRLLRSCPRLRVLATSREPLTVGGEAIFPVPALPTPQPGPTPPVTKLSRYASVALFVTRAQAVMPSFALSEDNRHAVAQICHRLDGLPLAIELAAAQVRALPSQQILDRLTDRFALLDRGQRGSHERQQTLRACMDWSFDLCSTPERLLWARLSVFADGCELDAIEEVCADACLPAADLVDVVAGLVDKSILVRADRDGARARFRMLETIRDYGRHQLVAIGEQEDMRRRHRDWCQRLVERASAEWISPRQVYWLGRLTREQPNLRTAIEYCLTEPGQAETALRLAITLPPSYAAARGLFGEVRRWLARALASAGAADLVRARALEVAGHFAVLQGDLEEGERLLDEAEVLASTTDVSSALAYLVCSRGLIAMFRTDLPAALDLFERAVALLAAAPQRERELDLYLRVLVSLGWAAGMAGNQARAETCSQEMLQITEARGEVSFQLLALFLASVTAWHQGHLEEATARMQKNLRIRRDKGWSDDRLTVAQCLDVLAWIRASQHENQRAATLFGAADVLLAELGTPIASHRQLIGNHDASQRQARDALGDTAFAAAFQYGRTFSLEAALDYALDERPQLAPAQVGTAPTALTRREHQVAALITQGLSNREIAGKLVISQRTAESHVEHILAKLGFTSRTQIAAWQEAIPHSDQHHA